MCTCSCIGVVVGDVSYITFKSSSLRKTITNNFGQFYTTVLYFQNREHITLALRLKVNYVFKRHLQSL